MSDIVLDNNQNRILNSNGKKARVEWVDIAKGILLYPEGMARSYLTGEWIDETIANQRPLAVMLGNTKIATPQYGITDADVIYEAAVEGQETRLMAIFQDYANLEKVMSIRSCRHYYVHWALEFDAIYAHYGQAKYAVEILSQDYVNNLSGLDGVL